MAVNIIEEHAGIRWTNVIEHHRNPSGQHNKIKWLLEQSHRDINKIHEIVSKIVMSGYDMISSWTVAEMIAIDVVKYGFKDRHEYLTALRNQKIYQTIREVQGNVMDEKCVIEGGEECKYEPVEIPMKTIWKMVKNGTWEGSLEQEEIEYNVEHGLYSVKQLKQYKKLLTKAKRYK